MTTRLHLLAGRPVGDPHRTFVLVVVVLATVAGLLTLVAQGPNHEPSPLATSTTTTATGARVAPAVPAAASDRASSSDAVSSGSAQQAARRFLTGYLAYLYGHGPAAAIGDATPRLKRRLAADRPRVSPATRRRHPRIVDLAIQAVPGAARWRVRATITDGGVASYPIAITLTRTAGGGVVVSGLLEAQ